MQHFIQQESQKAQAQVPELFNPNPFSLSQKYDFPLPFIYFWLGFHSDSLKR